MAPSTSMTIFAAVLSLGALVNAAPLVARDQPSTYPTTTSAAVPASTSSYSSPPIIPGPKAPVAVVFPDYTSQYNSKTGAVDFHTPRGLVSRSPTNGGADITTLVTFQLSNQYKNNQCQLVFDLVDPTSSVAGTAKAQLFTSLAPAYTDSESWPNGNLRNQFLGTVDIVAKGRATWEAGSGPGATVDGYFPCSTIAGQIYGGEVVPQGDYDQISWPAGTDGVKILVW